MKILQLFLLATLFVGCVSSKQYSGEPIPLENLSIIYTEYIRIYNIDDEWLGLGKPTDEYHLKPGHHTIAISYAEPYSFWRPNKFRGVNKIIISVNLEEGRLYRIAGFLRERPGFLKYGKWGYKFIDKESGKSVGKELESEFNW